MSSPPRSEITPEWLFGSRRAFLLGLAAASAALGLMACAGSGSPPASGGRASPPPPSPTPPADVPTPEETANAFNNYYEFSTNKSAVRGLAADLVTSPWSVAVGGLVRRPGSFALSDLVERFPQVERVERMRCVEAYSMVVPWTGFPLSQLLDAVEPTAEARYVRFEALYDPEQLPGQRRSPFTWPYVEGLRLDEARHPLTILATGAYGQPLTPQKGGPLRLVVPWKYGFKSIKAVVRIDLVAEQPATFWNTYAPGEYGFYSNVNPAVDHPRWSQASEYRVGVGRRPTLPFNGYAEEVAALYEGMDLRKEY
jgi:sulfoxide reductase catalytic subunit YedY